MRCEYIYRLLYNIYVYYVQSGTAKHADRPVCALLGPSDEVLTSGLRTTRQTSTHAHIHCS